MENDKKILLLLPDGVGLRNFAFSSFEAAGGQPGFDLVFWNATPFSLMDLGYREIQLKGKVNSKTDLLKRARKEIELRQFELKTGNPIYKKYSFLPSNKTWKQKLKNKLVRYFTWKYQNNLNALRNRIQQTERNSPYYNTCLETLIKEQPALVFCSNQRPVNAIAPLTAARDLGIPTASFIFSWDNLPKATMVVETNYYFVWSSHMEKELLFYYPHITKEQIIVTGTPQFEMHFDESLKQDRKGFCDAHQLDPEKKYICFSGDDITTSPHDPQYLEDVVKVIRSENKKKDEWRILFRRCPVDFSPRFDVILESYSNEIIPLSPLWKRLGEAWNTVLPTKDDNSLLLNTIAHSELVINVGSSMVFDALCQQKPCAYIAYNPEGIELKKDIHTIYKYIHFESMPKEAPVYWLKDIDQLPMILTNLGENKAAIIKSAQNWFETINQHPPQKASEHIWEGINKIVND